MREETKEGGDGVKMRLVRDEGEEERWEGRGEAKLLYCVTSGGGGEVAHAHSRTRTRTMVRRKG